MLRPKNGAPFVTQSQVDSAINWHITRACNLEALRDKQQWESPEYWRLHDLAIAHHEQARSLMPRGS